jgi:hypothetical protein
MVGGVSAGGPGRARVLSVGTRRISGRTTSSTVVPNWFTTIWCATLTLEPETKWPIKCSG